MHSADMDVLVQLRSLQNIQSVHSDAELAVCSVQDISSSGSSHTGAEDAHSQHECAPAHQRGWKRKPTEVSEECY